MKEKGIFLGLVIHNDLDFYCFGPMLGMDNVKYFFKVDYKSQVKSNIICNKSAKIVNLSEAQLETSQIEEVIEVIQEEKIKTLNPISKPAF